MSRAPRVRHAAIVAAFSFLAASGASAQGVGRAADVLRAAPGQAVAAAAGSHAATVSRALAARGADAATQQSIVVQSAGAGRAGLTHARVGQQVNGLSVYGAGAKATFDAAGNLVHLVDQTARIGTAAPAAARVDARAALDAAMATVHPTLRVAFRAAGTSGATARFAGGAFFHGDAEVTKVLVPQAGGGLAEGWLVQTWTQRANQLDHTLVSGDGAVLNVERRTANDSYNVFTVDPSKGGQAVVNGPGAAGNAQSPSGWLSGTQRSIAISGNNVSAYLDADANNSADAGGTAVTSDNFLTAANLTQAPTTAGNREVAVQNLFYLNNVIHDILYRHGFNEAAGNFQTNNFGKGGAGNDAVNAEAQDGGGTDNANFSTPTDGTRPRMQMYLWTGNGPTHEVVVGGTSYGATGAQFGPALTTTGVAGALAMATYNGGAGTDGCLAITSNVSGRMALVDRGTCDFVTKVKNAQNAGAVGVIVANNVPGEAPFTMGGTTRLRIPSVMVSQADGSLLRQLGGSGTTIRKKSTAPLQLDGDLDSDIVYHEYGHGLSWRMIGGMSGPLAGAIGEGASDVVAFMVNGNDANFGDVIGEYAYGNPAGIRRYRYAGYPLTYGNVTGAEVHDDGEIYAAAMWRLRELWIGAGRSTDDLFGHFVDGMNYTQATPAFEHMRDGMLASIAAEFGTTAEAAARCTLVWQAFAQYGIGAGASGTVSRRGVVTIVPSTVTRSTCN